MGRGVGVGGWRGVVWRGVVWRGVAWRGCGVGVAWVAGSALAVVTPALGGEWLPALASWQRGRAGALALLVAEKAAQAEPLEGRLASSGVAARVFTVGEALPLLNPPKPKRSARLSPFGRVIGG